MINQTDFAQSADGEVKLGQPMVKFSHSSAWGIIDAFVLPYFRERIFPGVDSPLSGGVEVTDEALYESDDEQNHIDYALRYSQYFGDWDIGLYYFNGTNREPIMTPVDLTSTPPIVQPFYDLLSQYGATVQATLGAWLWKREAVYREDSRFDYSAVSAGLEYTLFAITDTGADVGILYEYNYDGREAEATTVLQNDSFLGLRFTLNDIQDTNFLFGLGQDMSYVNSRMAFVEANRRFGERLRVTLDARSFISEAADQQLASLNDADYLSLEFEYFF